MQSPTFPTSPLAVIQTTLVSSARASTARLLALVFALLDPVWSRAALTVQAATLARLHARLIVRNARIIAAPDGSNIVALDDLLAALRERGPDPGGAGPAQSLRD